MIFKRLVCKGVVVVFLWNVNNLIILHSYCSSAYSFSDTTRKSDLAIESDTASPPSLHIRHLCHLDPQQKSNS